MAAQTLIQVKQQIYSSVLWNKNEFGGDFDNMAFLQALRRRAREILFAASALALCTLLLFQGILANHQLQIYNSIKNSQTQWIATESAKINQCYLKYKTFTATQKCLAPLSRQISLNSVSLNHIHTPFGAENTQSELLILYNALQSETICGTSVSDTYAVCAANNTQIQQIIAAEIQNLRQNT